MAWVYILECNDGTFYVGSTIDLDRRLWQHQEGLGAVYTRRRRPLRLAWSIEFDRVDEAFRFEKQVAGWRREKKLALMAGDWDKLPDLSSRSRAALRLPALPARLAPPAVPRPAPASTAPAADDDPWAPPRQ